MRAVLFLARSSGMLLFLLFVTSYVHAQTSNSSGYIIRGNLPALRNNIMITIDDCSIEQNVRWMFEFLRDHGYRAVFFPNTHYMVQQDPQLWGDIVAAGFEIGYHTRGHNAGMTPDQLTEDFRLFQEDVRHVLNQPGYTIHYIRPPRGVWNTDWLTWGDDNRLYTVQWDIVPPVEMDYFEGVLNHPDGGGIILLHTTLSNMAWLRDHLTDLAALRDSTGQRYIITTLSAALRD